ncbi:MAG: hypothetical protein KatS3mg022_2795 [Armatimonadota bacterium]|nr:MAG: hypothetical protein KatS3mg022_2795 [Armatimonadota bacterium]
MEEKDWFLNEYPSRFSFLIHGLGFGSPVVEDAGLYAQIVYPHDVFYAVFYYEAREYDVECVLTATELDRVPAKVGIVNVLIRLNILPNDLPRLLRRAPNRLDYPNSSHDRRLVQMIWDISQLYNSLWRSVSHLDLANEQEMIKRLMSLQADCYEYIWRTYGVRIVEWAKKSFGRL